MADYLSLFISAFIIGISIAAPVGPIGVLVIRRSLAEGRLMGLTSGLGAAAADTFYGFIAAFGLSAISSLLVSASLPLRIFGAAFLAYLGIKTLLSRPSDKAAEAKSSTNLLSAFLSTLALTITNPMTILSFLGIFAGMGLEAVTGNTFAASVMVLGVFAGSAAWWLLLSTGVSLFRERIDSGVMLWVNRLSGLIILGFALWIVWGLLTGA
jgi:threonine/homoserine/homoserine lactone efflux protein